MTDAWTTWLLTGALASSAGILLVLALRVPLRRSFGARVAYLAWTVVPLALLAVSLPGPRADATVMRWVPQQAIDIAVAGEQVVRPASPMPVDTGPSAAQMLLVAWLLGMVLAGWQQSSRQRRYLAALGPLKARADGSYQCAGPHGPVVIGLMRPRIVLPANFDLRYPGLQGQLVLAHERAHIRRGDVRSNLLAAVLRSVFWFNPLLLWAIPRFRFDQELACDAAVLDAYPGAGRIYGDAMLSAHMPIAQLPLGCHWHAGTRLKARIRMLGERSPGRVRSRAGVVLVLGILGACTGTAWALQGRDGAPVRLVMPRMAPALYADVHMSGRDANGISSNNMSADPKDADLLRIRAMDGSIEIDFAAGIDPVASTHFHAVLAEAGTTPAVDWNLQREGRRIAGGRVMLANGTGRVVLGPAMLGQSASATLDLVFSPDGSVEGDVLAPPVRGDDGIYRESERMGSTALHASGTASMLLDVSVDGKVMATRLESVAPRWAITDDDARMLLADVSYIPAYRNGLAVPSRVRMQLQFEPASGSTALQGEVAPSP